MEYSLEIFLRSMTLIVIVLFFSVFYLLFRNNYLSRIIIAYSFVCLTVIHIKWFLDLDLGSYDAALYHSIASGIHKGLKKDFLGNLGGIFQAYSAYTVPLGVVYFLFGDVQLIGQIFSMVIAIGVIVNLHRLAESWFDPKVAKLTSLSVALYPFGWILAGTLNRDLPIILFLTFFCCLVTDLQNAHDDFSRLWKQTLAVACVVYLTLLRPPLVILIAFSYSVYLLVKPKTSDKPGLSKPLKFLAILVVSAALGLLLFYLGTQSGAKTYLVNKAIQFLDFGEINKRLANSSEADSAYMTGVRFSSLQDIAVALPLAVTYFLFSPFPWQIHSAKHALGLIDSLLLILLSYYFIRGFPSFCRRNRRMALFLLAFVTAGVLTSSIIQANVGGAMRHRTMFSFLMLPVAAHGILNSPKRLRRGNMLLPAFYPVRLGRKTL